MNTKLRTEAKNDFENDFFKLMNNAVFGQLASEPKYHTPKYFSENLMAIEMKRKTKVKMNKQIYFGMSILDINKTLMYEFWYDYVKPKYGDRANLCYAGTDSVFIYIITKDFF